MPICSALLISAPSSGAGKTSVTAAIARFHARQGHCQSLLTQAAAEFRLGAAAAAAAAADMPPHRRRPGRRLQLHLPRQLRLPACARRRGVDLRTAQGLGLPACDALWLPGGYPELHATALREHPTFFGGLAAHREDGTPLLAECGGMRRLLDSLTDIESTTHRLAGLVQGTARLQKRFAALGLQALDRPEGALRGHTFHYSTMDTPLTPIAYASNPNAGRAAEALYALYAHGSPRKRYIHHYFPSNPEAVAAFFGQPHGN